MIPPAVNGSVALPLGEVGNTVNPTWVPVAATPFEGAVPVPNEACMAMY